MEVGSAPIQKESTLSTKEESLQLLAEKILNLRLLHNQGPHQMARVMLK
jgi:hypothetical protein